MLIQGEEEVQDEEAHEEEGGVGQGEGLEVIADVVCLEVAVIVVEEEVLLEGGAGSEAIKYNLMFYSRSQVITVP